MSDAQETKSIEERVSFLESKLQDLENRLLALEEPQENSAEPQSVALNITPEKTENKKSLISVTLARKTFHKGDYRAGDVGDRIDFNLLFRSDLPKDVRAFKGAVVIKDLFDVEIMRITLTQEAGIRAGGTSEWSGGIKYNQFLPPHQRLLTVDTKDAIASFDLENVIYTDGTRESFV